MLLFSIFFYFSILLFGCCWLLDWLIWGPFHFGCEWIFYLVSCGGKTMQQQFKWAFNLNTMLMEKRMINRWGLEIFIGGGLRMGHYSTKSNNEFYSLLFCIYPCSEFSIFYGVTWYVLWFRFIHSWIINVTT